MNFLIGFEISYNNLNLPTVIYTEGDMGSENYRSEIWIPVVKK